MDQGGKPLDAEGLHRLAIGIGECEDLIGPGAEEEPALLGCGPRDQPGHAAVGLIEHGQDACRRGQDPRALVGEGIERDEDQVEHQE